MEIEVGKVYKCGDVFIYIENISQKMGRNFKYIGIECGENGEVKPASRVGRFDGDGEYSCSNVECLQYWLIEPTKRETIAIGSSVYYKDEFEAATKHLKEVKQ